VEGLSSRRVEVPADGVLVVGRAQDADIHLDTSAASRHHARLIIAKGEVEIADLSSHNGTLLNGQRVEPSRAFRSGDVVAIGEATLILRSEPRLPARDVLDAGRIRQRAEDELDRAAEYARPLAVLHIA